MAPDLNSVPPSPRPRRPSTTAASGSAVAEPHHPSTSPSTRRDSHALNMGPPPAPHGGTSPTLGNATQSAVDNTGVGSGPGPLRHPRPLTIAEVHLELEKEQEAVMNRLTRELSLLRQQTASVASTASSTSTNVNNEHTDFLAQSGPSNSLPARDRSSSTLSSRSLAGNTAGGIPSLAPSRDGGVALSSRPSLDRQRSSFSREASSVPSHHPPETTSPLLSSSLHQHGEHLPQTPSRSHSHAHRSSASSIPPLTAAGRPLSPGQSDYLRPSHASSPSRYEEVAQHRAELEAVKRENEVLRRRVRCLEATVRQNRRERTGSVTTTSSMTGGLRDTEITDPQASSHEPEIIPDRIS